jgi:hypothetical protein
VRFHPVELREIVRMRDEGKLSNLDRTEHLIVAHFTDVRRDENHTYGQSGFSELVKFMKATCILHTYDPGFGNESCKWAKLLNSDNVHCVGSEMLVLNIRKFVENWVDGFKPQWCLLYGGDSEHDKALKLFRNTGLYQEPADEKAIRYLKGLGNRFSSANSSKESK